MRRKRDGLPWWFRRDIRRAFNRAMVEAGLSEGPDVEQLAAAVAQLALAFKELAERVDALDEDNQRLRWELNQREAQGKRGR